MSNPNAPTGISTAPTAAWDLKSFFENATDYVGVIGGGLIGLIGLVLVIWTVVLVAKKFLGNSQQAGDSWFKLVAMFLIGGAMVGGGIVLINNIALGGQATVEELGGGFILLGSLR